MVCTENMFREHVPAGTVPRTSMNARHVNRFWRNSYDTVEPLYNEVLGTMKITLLYQGSHYISVKKQRNIKSWDQQNYLVIRGFCYIQPLYNEVPLYMTGTSTRYTLIFLLHQCTCIKCFYIWPNYQVMHSNFIASCLIGVEKFCRLIDFSHKYIII